MSYFWTMYMKTVWSCLIHFIDSLAAHCLSTFTVCTMHFPLNTKAIGHPQVVIQIQKLWEYNGDVEDFNDSTCAASSSNDEATQRWKGKLYYINRFDVQHFNIDFSRLVMIHDLPLFSLNPLPTSPKPTNGCRWNDMLFILPDSCWDDNFLDA